MGEFDALAEAVIAGDANKAVAETQNALAASKSAQDILDKGLIAALDEVGERFSKGLLFVPQMLRAAKTMQACMEPLQPYLKEGEVASKGKVLIGTVKGDLHDIGKNLVSMMIEGAGFAVTDLGVDVPPEKFVQKVQEIEPDIVALSALLSTTMPAMAEAIEALKQAGVRNKVKVLIGGAPVTETYAWEIKADSYAPDAGSAVVTAKKLLGIS